MLQYDPSASVKLIWEAYEQYFGVHSASLNAAISQETHLFEKLTSRSLVGSLVAPSAGRRCHLLDERVSCLYGI